MLGQIDLFKARAIIPTGDGGAEGAMGRIHQVICGGETGHNARPIHPDWVRSLRDQCAEAGVPFFFKGDGEWHEVGADGVRPSNICISEDGFIDTAGTDYVCFANESDGVHLRRWKISKNVSRLLDGRTHDELAWNE